jgi:hypothetical protein
MELETESMSQERHACLSWRISIVPQMGSDECAVRNSINFIPHSGTDLLGTTCGGSAISARASMGNGALVLVERSKV